MTATDLWTFCIAGVIYIATASIVIGLRELIRRRPVRSTWAAPKPVDVEWWPWMDERDDMFADTPIYAQLRREDDVWFAASVLADIEDLPGVSA